MIAFDTNVLVYACDKSDVRRQQIALDLVTGAADAVLPWQVACEFIAASRKLTGQGFTPSAGRGYQSSWAYSVSFSPRQVCSIAPRTFT